jgi:hypothetical protein
MEISITESAALSRFLGFRVLGFCCLRGDTRQSQGWREEAHTVVTETWFVGAAIGPARTPDVEGWA